MGAGFTYTEMVSAHGLLHGAPQTESYLDRDPEEAPFAVQIFAAEPEVLARGAEIAVRRGAGIVDINMACPVRKVCSSGAGAALARDPERVRAAVSAVSAACGVPVTVKIRAGWDEESLNCVEVGLAAESAGAAAVAIHGRTRAQGYAGSARWELIRKVKEAVKIPVLGSGDVWSAADALRMARETGCDAVLVARGACGNPWIFRDIEASERGLEPPPPSRDDWAEVVMRHVELQIEHRRRQAPGEDPATSEERAIRELRKHLLWYTSGRRGGARFRREASALRTAGDVRRLIDIHFPRNGDGFVLDPALIEKEPAADGSEGVR
jgi:tRNA-dihydrouridine synthase B